MTTLSTTFPSHCCRSTIITSLHQQMVTFWCTLVKSWRRAETDNRLSEIDRKLAKRVGRDYNRVNKWSKNYDERPHCGGGFFHGGKVNVKPASREQCSRLHQSRWYRY